MRAVDRCLRTRPVFVLAQVAPSVDALDSEVVLLVWAVSTVAGPACWFLPVVVSVLRGHHNTFSIFLLTLLLGWTFVGWVVALVWSFTAVQHWRNH